MELSNMEYVMTSAQARRVIKAGLNLGDVCNRINRHNRAVRDIWASTTDCHDLLPTFREALMWARRAGVPCVELVMAADDSLELVRFGPRGGHRRLTKLTPTTKG